MSDQAQSLRQMASSLDKYRLPPRNRQAKIITITSGKGGVGKSNFTLNFALALQSLGRKVLVFDADIGMANIDVLMGANSQYNLLHLLKREKSIDEIIQTGIGGLPYIAGGSGMSELFTLSDDDLNYFAEEVEKIAADMDYILFDTGAGLSKENLKFITSADECLVVTTPEPTSLTDAYALIKVVNGLQKDTVFKIIVNRADNDNEARQVADKIALVAKRFLEIEIPLLGHISDDTHVMQAVKRQVPFMVAFPGCVASRDVLNLAHRFAAMPQIPQSGALSGIKGFMQKWLRRSVH
ncbi:Flagellum site-determining protein YlxH [Paenibacillus polymyxa E681]|uniref:MinD/ParA family protein n=1 Tax=Paenibacillus polymyxa TaxID=1406 RepID=UPI0001E315A3|nr:MinD/ParA family protein [Paenibacillus polymyxa]ADM69741.1 cobyrinic acid a,c-diamide synthase [Paenibacillus polymyxa E681]QNV56761.1 Flagellum site-determining protein YlxH [Paenibacillus polymyxa E681]QNV61598.1 Flagellum site-determining protein YlxH [Paenibacillus polymyxa E681]